MKAVISNRIYLNCEKGSDLEDYLSSNLTYTIDRMPVSEYPEIIKHMTRISDTAVSIPSGRTDLIPEDYKIIDKRAYVDAKIPEPSFTLRPDQQECLDYFAETATTGGLIDAKPGWGKSIMGLAIAHQFQLKTLIVCTTTMIRDMWVKEIKKFFGFTPGIIGGGSYTNQHAPITVGNIQTVNKMATKLSSTFGMVILDECHHCTATTFTNVLFYSRASVKIGLSGTHRRKDGKHILFKDYFGDCKYTGIDINRVKPTIWQWQSKCELSGNHLVPWALRVNKLFSNEVYFNEIHFLADQLGKAGHKVLVVADRVDFLERLHKATPNSLIIAGEYAKDEHTRSRVMKAVSSGKATHLYATQSIFSEGVSLNELSAIILATPLNNESLVEQLIGRIMRQADGKLDPIAVDIKLEGVTGRKQANGRMAVYVREGWKVFKNVNAGFVVNACKK